MEAAFDPMTQGGYVGRRSHPPHLGRRAGCVGRSRRGSVREDTLIVRKVLEALAGDVGRGAESEERGAEAAPTARPRQAGSGGGAAVQGVTLQEVLAWVVAGYRGDAAARQERLGVHHADDAGSPPAHGGSRGSASGCSACSAGCTTAIGRSAIAAAGRPRVVDAVLARVCGL